MHYDNKKKTHDECLDSECCVRLNGRRANVEKKYGSMHLVNLAGACWLNAFALDAGCVLRRASPPHFKRMWLCVGDATPSENHPSPFYVPITI